MGGLQSLLGKMPMGAKIPGNISQLMDDEKFQQMDAIIDSMTLKERAFPNLINPSRKRRIAKGSGVDLQAVNRLMKQFNQMQKTLKRFKGDKMNKQMKHLQQQLPPELQQKLKDDEGS